MLLWLPLGIAALAVSVRRLGLGPWLLGVAAGVIAIVVVALLAFILSRRS